jgi:hypothetical protein
MLSAERLQRVTWQCVHFCSTDDASGARDALHGDLRILELDLDSPAQLMTAIARAFQFPDYFGENWDALDECLRDLEWLPAAGYVLFLRRSSDLWARDPQSAGALVESWLMAAEEWAQRGIPFHLVFVW